MSVALRGNLDDFGIADVFQLIGQQRKTGVLEFDRKGEHVRILFERGAVVSAAPVGARQNAALGDMLVRCGLVTRAAVEALHEQCEASAESFPRLAAARGLLSEREIADIQELLTRETIFSILRWSTGSFDFTAQELDEGAPSGALLPAEQILMDGLRMVDEWQNFAELVPSEDLVFQRSGSFEAYHQRSSRHSAAQLERAERVYMLVDGRLSVRRVIDLSRLGTFDAMQILAELRRAGALEPVSAEALRKRRRSRRVAPVRPSQVGGWLAAALPLALLLAAVAVGWSRDAPGLAASFAIERGPLEAAREAFDARRVRHALEVYRFAEGRWPSALAELAARGVARESALAVTPGRPYYYVRRTHGPVLLAPERPGLRSDAARKSRGEG